MADGQSFRYEAIDPSGKRVRGVLAESDETLAYETLRRSGLSPLSLKPAKARTKTEGKVLALADKEAADFLASLADLLGSGADIRTALSILGSRFERPAIRTVCQNLTADIGGGEALEAAFGRNFNRKQAFVAPMIAAGEASGDLAGGLRRASEVVTSRTKLRDQMVTVLAYPTFVFVSALAALLVILLYIVPTIAPLASETGGRPPASLALMISLSGFLRENIVLISGILAGSFATLLTAARLGALSGPIDYFLFDGPLRRTAGGLVFGSFAISLGAMLSAGAPISEALRLAIRSVTSKGARKRLEPVSTAVRQGLFLSDALGAVSGFPPSIVRLAAVGEASNALGKMLDRGGRYEEAAALARIETVGRVAGPTLIVLLGAVLGVIMAGLLSGVSSLGQSALG